MNRTFSCILLLLSWPATFTKYVFVDVQTAWDEAQYYCRLYHTDLAPVSNAYDTQRLYRLVGDSDSLIWIGLERDPTDRKEWRWSGGRRATALFWGLNQPNNIPRGNYGAIYRSEWYNFVRGFHLPFFCYYVIVVRERKTWEEALEYCREHHTDLASVASDTETLLIQKELDRRPTTEHVWIGLHFFPGGWLWVDKQPLKYEAWGQEGKPACPRVSLECGALRVTAGNSTRTAPAQNTNNTWNHVYENNREMSGLRFTRERDAAEELKVWEAHECEEKLHFLCY